MFAWRRTALRRRVVVNLKTDKAFRGILFSAPGPLLVLKEGELLEAGREPVKIDGDVVLEKGNVDFLQVLPGPEA